MTCKYVKELLEELQRFNPEARLEQEVEVGGHSPNTICTILAGETAKDIKLEELQDALDKIDLESEERIEAIKELKGIMESEKYPSSKLSEIHSVLANL